MNIDSCELSSVQNILAHSYQCNFFDCTRIGKVLRQEGYDTGGFSCKPT